MNKDLPGTGGTQFTVKLDKDWLPTFVDEAAYQSPEELYEAIKSQLTPDQRIQFWSKMYEMASGKMMELIKKS